MNVVNLLFVSSIFSHMLCILGTAMVVSEGVYSVLVDMRATEFIQVIGSDTTNTKQ
jgi:hypothetical protein